jgi:transposase-like protein
MREFSLDYKRDAVALVLQNDRHIRQAAFELGISYNTLKCRVKKHDREVEAGEFPGGFSAEEECRLCQVSRGGYYKWLKRPVKPLEGV